MLEEQTISFNLAQTVNTKSDDKISDPGQMSVVKNARYTQDKRIAKRQGMTGQALTLQGDPGFINPVAIQAGSAKSKVFAHENQLCMLNNGNLFSQYQGQNKWAFKGTCVPLEISTKKLSPSITFTDVGTTSGVTALIGSANVWIIEEASGNIVAKTVLSGTEVALRVINFSSALYVLTTDTATTNLYARPVTLSTGALGSRVTIATDYSGGAGAAADIAITSGSAINEAAFIAYSAASFTKVVPFLSTGSVSSLGTKTTTLTPGYAAITIEPSVNANKFYIASAAGVECYTFTSSAYTTAYTTTFTPTAPTYLNLSATYNNVAISLSPVNNSDLYIFVDTIASTDSLAPSNSFSDDDVVVMLTVNSSGTVTANAIYGYGYLIAAKPIRDTVRKSIYLPCVYVSPLQKTMVLMDMLEGSALKTTYCVGKCLYGLAAAPTNSYLPQSSLTTGSSFRTVVNSYLTTMNLAPSNAQQAQYTARTTHLTGGILWAFDGDSLSEHNFVLEPENMQATTGQVGMIVTVGVVGDASHAETFTVTFRAATSLQRTSNNYFTFNTTTTAYYVWYTVDGVGTDPAIGGRTGRAVALLSTDNTYDVAIKTKLALAGISGAISTVQSSNSITILNTSNGAVTAPAVGGNGRTGALSSGTGTNYQYCHVYKWTDRNSQVYRSAPSVPVAVSANANDAGYIVAWAPPITNKLVSSVSVELYRTSSNGSTFQLAAMATMPSTGGRVVFYDQMSDATLQTQAILYTNGGILENASNVGAVTTISQFKERLATNNVDDIAAVYYSKSNVVGEPINFTQETFFRVDADKNAVSAIAGLDDKLCVFKKGAVYALSGDGADDLGNNSSFSAPLAVASDVGTSNPNSVVLYPNGLLFKSDKGIYELSRSLGVSYRGAPVEQYNANTVSSGALMPSVTEVRFTLSDTATALVYNYYFDRWDFFDNYQYDSACVWQDQYVTVTNAGRVYVESASNNYDYNGSANVSYSLYVLTPWLKIKNVQDFQRIKRLAFLGEYVSPHTLTVNVYYDYITTSFDTYTFNGQTISSDGVYNPEIHLKRQKCEAIRIEIYETPSTGSQGSLVLNQCDALVGLKRGLYKRAAGKTA